MTAPLTALLAAFLVGCGLPQPSVSGLPLEVCSKAVSGNGYTGMMYCSSSKLYVQTTANGAFSVFPEGYHDQAETGLACAFTVGEPIDGTHCRVDDPNEYTK